MFAICFYCKVYTNLMLLNIMRYNFIVREKKNNVVGGCACGRSRVQSLHAIREKVGYRVFPLLDYLPWELPGFEATQSQVQTMSEKTEMARILMLVACASLLSFGKLSVLASESPTALQPSLFELWLVIYTTH